MIVTIYKENTAAITAPSGWTQVAQVATTAVQQSTTFWHRASAAESGSVTFTWTGSTYRTTLADRFSGVVTTGSPVDGTPVTAFSNSNVSATPAVSLTASAGSMQYWTATNFAGGNTFTASAGYSAREQNAEMITGTKANASGGATGSVSGSANVSGPSTATLLSLQGADTATTSPTTSPTPSPTPTASATASPTPTITATATPTPTTQYVDIQSGSNLYDAVLGIGTGMALVVLLLVIHVVGSWGNR